jgi:hypothetical protein
MSQVSEDLEAAYAYLDEHGWCQGAAQPNSDGNVCIEGAIAAVTMGHPALWSVRSGDPGMYFKRSGELIHYPDAQDVKRHEACIYALINAAPQRRDIVLNDQIYPYNDHESTTVEDVKLLLKRAIEAA